MTRINAGIPVESLVRQHLIAEHREIKRIPNVIRSGRYNLKGMPDKFKLGQGHVKFFYNKLVYLLRRYRALYKECKARGYNVTNYEGAWDGLPPELMNDWIPTKETKEIVQQRINEKLEIINKR